MSPPRRANSVHAGILVGTTCAGLIAVAQSARYTPPHPRLDGLLKRPAAPSLSLPSPRRALRLLGLSETTGELSALLGMGPLADPPPGARRGGRRHRLPCFPEPAAVARSTEAGRCRLHGVVQHSRLAGRRRPRGHVAGGASDVQIVAQWRQDVALAVARQVEQALGPTSRRSVRPRAGAIASSAGWPSCAGVNPARRSPSISLCSPASTTKRDSHRA
jgi:hypothetical protein